MDFSNEIQNQQHGSEIILKFDKGGREFKRKPQYRSILSQCK